MMKRLIKMNHFVIYKSPILLILWVGFVLAIPIIFKLCIDIITKAGEVVELRLTELPIIVSIWILAFSTIFFFRQQRSKMILEEKIHGYSTMKIFISKIVVLELWMLPAITIFLLFMKEMYGIFDCYSFFNFLVVVLIYFKYIFVFSVFHMMIHNSLITLIISWMFFSVTQVLLIGLTEVGGTIPGVFSYCILNQISNNSVIGLDVILWSISSLIELIVLSFIVNYSLKKIGY